jgi:4-hydroxybenzoate polyprenyltransferase
MPQKGYAKQFLTVLEMIKFEHTIFALPFAFLGAFLGSRGVPEAEKSIWILLAMIGARSAAMAFNRLVDFRYDSLNPRTANRALPRGLLSRRFVGLFVVVSSGLLVFSAWNLNRLAFYLAPIALLVILGYSYTKRFTSLSHIFLGISLAIAPLGGWIAVRGTLNWEPLVLAASVLFWVSGFDIIYACMDTEFDRRIRLFSFPSRFGIKEALRISAIFHVMMVVALILTVIVFRLSVMSWIAVFVVSITLIYEHSLVKPHDLNRINMAFFTANSIISVLLLAFIGLDLCLFV